MYENMLSTYRIWFEGLPYPVFYKSYYPMGGNDAEWLWDLFNYAQGLKHDKDQDERKFNDWHNVYIDDLRELFNTVMSETPHQRRGVVVIPSSTAGAVNRATKLVREVLETNPRPFADLTKTVYRQQTKQIAHDSGQRSYQSNYQTLGISSTQDIQSLDAIIVIDDILTSGTSFRAMNQFLVDAGFEGKLYNFAFARTTPVEGIKNILNHESDLSLKGFARINALSRIRPTKSNIIRYGFQVIFDDGTVKSFDSNCVCIKRACYTKVQTESGAYRVEYDPVIKLRFGDMEVEFADEDDVRRSFKNISYRPEIEGIVFDFDQTLLNDTIRDMSYEEGVTTQPFPYRPYDGIRELMELGIPYAIVSNRPQMKLRPLIRNREVEMAVYPDRYLPREDGEPENQLNIIYHGNDIHPDKIILRPSTLPKNLFSYPRIEDMNGFPCNYYKPCIQGINQALIFLFDNFDLPEPEARIIGVGNTPEDIIAYNTAGLESCLALWGVPDYLKDYATEHWGADHVFERVQDFTEWCRNGGHEIVKR